MRMVIREIKQAVLHSAAVMSVGRRDARCAGLIFFVKHLSDLLASFENWDWDYILPHDFLCSYFLASVQQEDPKAVTIERYYPSDTREMLETSFPDPMTSAPPVRLSTIQHVWIRR